MRLYVGIGSREINHSCGFDGAEGVDPPIQPDAGKIIKAYDLEAYV